MVLVIVSQLFALVFAIVLLALFDFDPSAFALVVVLSSLFAFLVVWWMLRSFRRDSDRNQTD